MFLGGLLDGLLGSRPVPTGPSGPTSSSTRPRPRSLPRSRIEAPSRTQVEAVDGVEEVGALGACSSVLGQATARQRDLLVDGPVRLRAGAGGRARGTPGPGRGGRRRRLEADGVEMGDTLLLGPARTPVTRGRLRRRHPVLRPGDAVGLARHVARRHGGQPARTGYGDVVQALVVDAPTEPSRHRGRRHRRRHRRRTTTLTLAAAVEAMPGVSQQRSTFNQIIGVTVVVAVVVVALFFALITVERTASTACSRPSGRRRRRCSPASCSRRWSSPSSPPSSVPWPPLALDAADPARLHPFQLVTPAGWSPARS